MYKHSCMQVGGSGALSNRTRAAETHHFAHCRMLPRTLAGCTEIQGAAALAPQYPCNGNILRGKPIRNFG